MKKIYLLLLVFPLFGFGVRAQISLVKPMNLYQYLSPPVNGKLLFFGTAGNDANYELWSTDGTAAGTQLVKDIFPGPDGGALQQSTWLRGANIYRPIVYNNALYFVAGDGIQEGIWKSDGTAVGTNILPANNGTILSFDDQDWPYFCVFNGLLYFTADDNVHGIELWKTDGTTPGTTMVKDIATSPLFGSHPSHLTVFNGALYFAAYDDAAGVEVFKSDGTAAGTAVLKDVFPGLRGSLDDGFTGSINPQFTVSGNYLYWVASDDSVNNLYGLYRTDGTAAGTVLLSDHLLPQEMTDVNGTLLFYADDLNDITNFGLFKSDGTAAGTVKVPINSNILLSPSSQLWNKSFYSFNGKLYFPAINHGVADSLYLYQSDGTVAGTFRVDSLGVPSSGIQASQYNRDGTNGSFFFQQELHVKGSSQDYRMIESNGLPNQEKIYWGVTALGGGSFLNGDLYLPGNDTTGTRPSGLYKITPSLASVPLPVTWLAFDATLTAKNTVDLSWQTASERNNKGFFVERSTDGVHFSSLQWVPGAGTTPEDHSYAWTDEYPVTGADYYRINQVDLDARSSYSVVKKIDLSVKSRLSVAPNPVTGNLLVIRHSMSPGQGRLQITDMAGRVVLAQTVTLGGNALSGNIGSLKAGVYLLTLTAESQAPGTCLFVKE